MATSSAAIPPTRRGKSGHFTVHSTAAKSCISNTSERRVIDNAARSLYSARTIRGPPPEGHIMVRGALAALILLTFAATALAAPAGPPIRIGGTLALTGPLAPTALLHKIAGEIYVDE